MQASRPPKNIEQVSFTATPQGLDELHKTLERFWNLCDQVPHAPPHGVWRHKFTIAVGEIGGNIVRYAYADVPGGAIELRLRLLDDYVAHLCRARLRGVFLFQQQTVLCRRAGAAYRSLLLC